MKKKYFTIAKEMVLAQKKVFLSACSVTLLQSALLLCIPLLYQKLIDNVLPQKDVKIFLKIIFLVLLMYTINSCLNILKDYLLAKFAENIARDLRQKLNDRISILQYDFFDKNDTANLIAKYSKDIDSIKENFGYMMIKVFGNIVSLLSASIMLLLLDVRVLIATLLIMILYIISNKVLGMKVKKAAQTILQCNEESIDAFSENCNNILLTKLYNAYDLVSTKFKQTYKKQYNSQIKLEILYSCNLNVSCLLIYFLAIIIWLIGGFGIIHGSMSIGLVMAMINYQTMLLSPLNFLCEFNNSYQATVSALGRVESIFSYRKESINSISSEKCENIYNIAFNNVVFGYGREKVLNGDNLKFTRGNIYGVLGSSGSGKSTIAKLILKLYEPESGEITINDSDIHKLDTLDIRKKVILIAQESQFYKGTIKNNITFWNSECDWNNVLMLSSEFELDKEIERMPEKWDTLLNSGANNISGGQKKRLDIIRGIVKDTDVIIFDESTAYLDIEKRKALFKVVNMIKKDKIIIFITHNLEEVSNYNVIYAFEKGKIKKIESKYVQEIYK